MESVGRVIQHPIGLLGRLLSSVYDLLNGIFVVMANKKTTRSFEHR